MSLSAARRGFLKGGALCIGLVLGGCALPSPRATSSHRLRDPDPSARPPGQVDSWLVVHDDDTATLYMGFAELGQGATTALLQVAAEELDLDMDQISAAPLDTHLSPNQGGTYSSASVQRGRPQVAAAAAEARAALLAMAGARLGEPVGALRVVRGRVHGGGPGSVSYGELIRGCRFDVEVSGNAPRKHPSQYRIVGTPAPRVDIAAKLAGTHEYIQHLRLPSMLHGRILRPQGQAAYGAGARVLHVDEGALHDIPGARLLRRGDFLGVVAPREWDAVRAARTVRITWDDTPSLPPVDALHAHMQADTTSDQVVLEQGDVRGVGTDVRRVSFKGNGPYQAHAPFAPNCALADIRPGGGLVICSSQDIHAARRSIAPLVGLAPTQLRVQYAEGSGTYGHSCYDDAAQAAALLSQLAGAPVRVQFMRADEHGWDTFGPAHVGEVRIAADGEGRLVAYEYEGWQHNWSLVETTAQLAGHQPATEWPVVSVQGVSALVCGGMYAIANRRLVNHRLPALQYPRAAWLRSPLDLSFTFVSEQAIDQLAFELGQDPRDFRRRNIADARWRDVLDAAAASAGWTAARTPGRLETGRLRRGRGIGLGTHLVSHGAAVADIEVDTHTGRVRVLHLTAALDAGLVVNPRIVERQIEGQLVQTASRMLLEEVRFDETRVNTLDWQSYPILRFADCPSVTPIVLQRLDQPSTGAGEETMAAAAAAIANAFFDATGRRMTRYPFLPQRVLEVLAAG